MKKENLPWIIIPCTILLCLMPESWGLPASKTPLQLLCAFCQVPSASMPLPCLRLDQAGRWGTRRDQISSEQIFYPFLGSPVKLGWLCRGAYGNLCTAFRVHASICIHSSQMACARGFIPHTMLSVTLGCSLSYLFSQCDLHSPPPYIPNNAYFCVRNIFLLSYRPQHLPNCFYLQLLAGY